MFGKLAAIVALGTVFLAGCDTAGGYRPVSDRLGALTVSFAGGGWTGQSLPPGQHCRRWGGDGATPPLRIEGIPAGVNAIILEFNDLDFAPLATDGGHGKIGFWHEGGASATLPAVPGGTATLPAGSFVEAHARGQNATGGYQPPCSGGRGNVYAADVKAVYKARKEGEENKLFATGHIRIGRY
jgi:hypothetical protein